MWVNSALSPGGNNIKNSVFLENQLFPPCNAARVLAKNVFLVRYTLRKKIRKTKIFLNVFQKKIFLNIFQRKEKVEKIEKKIFQQKQQKIEKKFF